MPRAPPPPRRSSIAKPLGDLEPGPAAVLVEAVAEVRARVVGVAMPLEPADGRLRLEGPERVQRVAERRARG